MSTARSSDTTDRGVSSTVGVVLVVAIVVLLATIVGTLTSGIVAEQPEPPPLETFSVEHVPDGEDNTNNRPYVDIVHNGMETVSGDEVKIVDGDGNSIYWEDVWTGGPTVEPGEHVHIDGFGSDSVLNPTCQGEVYQVIWEGETRDYVLNEVHIDTPAQGPAATHC